MAAFLETIWGKIVEGNWIDKQITTMWVLKVDLKSSWL